MPEEDEEGFFDFILQEERIKTSEAMRGGGEDHVRGEGGRFAHLSNTHSHDAVVTSVSRPTAGCRPVRRREAAQCVAALTASFILQSAAAAAAAALICRRFYLHYLILLQTFTVTGPVGKLF